MSHIASPEPGSAEPHLQREIGLWSATTLNMIDMIGVGPFITIPLIISAMGGPQAMLGWVLGALFAICDGLIWAELGAAMPGSGGSYRYLREMFGSDRWGRFLAFLFIWQLSFSAPMSIATGCIGFAHYGTYLWPSLDHTWLARDFQLAIPFFGPLQARIQVKAETFLAIATCVTATFLLYRRIGSVGKISRLLWVGVIGTIAWIIFAGLTHFSASRAFSFPPNAFHLDERFFLGLGAAMLVAAYDYWGYYNVCFLGGEVKDPTRNIPRALLISIIAVAVLYLTMNISVLGVLPWQELQQTAQSDTHNYTISLFMQHIYGTGAAQVVTILIMWTAFASVFSLLLGYSRVPYAAARDGNYFRAFGRVHSRHRIPHISLFALGGVAILFCFLRLADVIAALVVIRIMIQFLVQAVGLLWLRATRPDFPRPFRMWLYPLPALFAILGFIYVLIQRPGAAREIRYGIIIIIIGTLVFLVRSWRTQEWPFGQRSTSEPLPD
ncbi:MAG TPA: APC family permease [Terriglobales bacterium]|nr:APC family permease [Terriglobales bacterium]